MSDQGPGVWGQVMTCNAKHQAPRALLQEKLNFLLSAQAKAADPEQQFQLHKAIQRAQNDLAALYTREERDREDNGPRIDLAKLPAGVADFLGREAELAILWSRAREHQITVTPSPVSWPPRARVPSHWSACRRRPRMRHSTGYANRTFACLQGSQTR